MKKYRKNPKILPYKETMNTKWDMKSMAMVMITGFGVGFVYYGIQLYVENLNFNLYFTVAINAISIIPPVFIGSILLSFTSRRLLFSCSVFLTWILCISCIFYSIREYKKWSLPQLMVEAVGFMAASTAFDVLHIYCVELFPTMWGTSLFLCRGRH